MYTIKTYIDQTFPSEEMKYSDFCTLKSIAAECPWKKFEGLTPQAFVMQNFKAFEEEHLPNYRGFFTQFLATITQEIGFIKLYIDAFKCEQWVTIYRFSNFGKEKYLPFALGGEPLKTITPSSIFQQRGWKAYPAIFEAFWKIHGFFELKSGKYNKGTFGLEELKYLQMGFMPTLNHPKLINRKDMSIKTELLKGWGVFKEEDRDDDTICVENMYHFDSVFAEEECYAYTKEIENYFLKPLENAIPFDESGFGDYDFLMKSRDNTPYLFRWYHSGGGSYFYHSLESFLMESMLSSLEFYRDISPIDKQIEGYHDTLLEQTSLLDNEAHLYGKNVKVFPEFLKNYPNLKRIDLSNNKIKTIPSWITDFKNLEVLNLRKNKIKVLPTTLTQLQRLNTLDLEKNRLKSLDINFSQFKQLVYLTLSKNRKLSFENINPSLFSSEIMVYFDGIKKVKDTTITVAKYFTSKTMLDVNYCEEDTKETLRAKRNVLEKRLALYPKEWYAHYKLGKHHRRQTQAYQKAEKYLLQAYGYRPTAFVTEKDFDFTMVLEELAQLYFYDDELCNPQKSQKIFLELFGLYEQEGCALRHEEYYSLYADLLIEDFNNQEAEAMRYYEKALQCFDTMESDYYEEEISEIKTKMRQISSRASQSS